MIDLRTRPGEGTVMSELSERCRGSWPGILMALGVLNEKALRHKDVPCPTCGGRDRFRYTDKGYGRWYCRGCRVAVTESHS
jgi:putative DNA primase/helicase